MKMKLIILSILLTQMLSASANDKVNQIRASLRVARPEINLQETKINKSFLLKKSIEERIQVLEILKDRPEDFNIDENILDQALRLGREGNGGDDIAAEFFEIGAKLRDQIEGQQALLFSKHSIFDDINLDLLDLIVEKTAVFSVNYKLCSRVGDYRCRNERGFVAKNFPETLEIHVNQQRWESLTDHEKLKIVFHEYLGLLGHEEGTYNLSSLLVVDAKEQSSFNNVSCSFSYIDQLNRLHSGAASGVKHSILSGGVPLMMGNHFNYMISYVISTGYLRIELREGKPFANSVMPKFEVEPILPEVIVFDGAVEGRKSIEFDKGKLVISCTGV
ncbi:hypothetical protein M902_0871 [Bacteriovorax sp. BAL6_X]|nr:hypothetical protein M902_0871 [Bacteriovorax sp. BAL6_X]